MSNSPYRILLERLIEAAGMALASGSEGSLEQCEVAAGMLLIASRSRMANVVAGHVREHPEEFWYPGDGGLLLIELGELAKTEPENECEF
ncbi:MAG: hypothetical protein AMXMBFR13_34560 [Phycisphaerae bacterium]